MFNYHPTVEVCTSLPTRDQLEQLLRALKADNMAIALAMPQIGINSRAFAVKSGIVPELGSLYINPEIIRHSLTKQISTEGCRSLPGQNIQVPRYSQIVLKYSDFRGNIHRRTLSGFASRIVQHEIDHLNGIMITGEPHNA